MHLGLGNFFRAHQAGCTEHASDAEGWGYAAFTGRSAGVVRVLQEQDGLCTLVARGPHHDAVEVVATAPGRLRGRS